VAKRWQNSHESTKKYTKIPEPDFLYLLKIACIFADFSKYFKKSKWWLSPPKG